MIELNESQKKVFNEAIDWWRNGSEQTFEISGPPGSGKTLLAKSFPSIMPTLTFPESLEVTKIHSVSGKLSKAGIIYSRPFRAPHHTSSKIALTGGGRAAKPGEVSLAHNGVLFLY